MSMDLAVIRQMLRLVGITGLVVRFDVQNQQVVANFKQGSEAHTEFIKFAAIEDLFTEAPIQVHTGPPQLKPSPGGGQ